MAKKTVFFIIIVLMLSAPAAAAAPVRVVSLKPSITDVVVALGLGDRLAGITRYCDVPQGMARPEIVADYTRPYIERIVAIAPDLVLGSRENASRRSIEALERSKIRVALFPFSTIPETLASIRGIATALGEPQRGEQLARAVEQKFAALASRWDRGPRVRTVVVWGTRPLVAAGPGTYMDELLASIGAENVVRKTKVSYPRISLEDLIALDPDAIVDLSMGSESRGLAAAERPWDGLTTLRAVRLGRIISLDAGLFRAGPRLAEGLEKLAALLHDNQNPSFVRRGMGR